MTLQPQFVRKDTFDNQFTHEKETMDLVKVVDEPTRVGSYKFRNTHYYDRDKNGHLHQWFMNPFHNQTSDYDKYRKAFNLMKPDKIKKLRNYYGFSLRELAVLFGMSYSTLSDIESGKYIQSVAQNNILRNLINPPFMAYLLDDNLPRIKNSGVKMNKHFKGCIDRVYRLSKKSEMRRLVENSDIKA